MSGSPRLTVGPRLIVGLGNVGAEYEQTRHNAGFWFVEGLASQLGAAWHHESRFHGDLAKVRTADCDLYLLKPSTYMNRSGLAVVALARFFKILPEQILAVHDELDLPPGSSKLKKGGGHGGHNGLRDLHAHLGSGDYWRLRIGIGHPGDKNRVADYVLHRAGRDEQAAIDASIDKAWQVMPRVLAGDYAAAAQLLHTQPSAAKPAATRGAGQTSDPKETS